MMGVFCEELEVVTLRGRGFMLEELHVEHPGVSRMKALASGVVWWFGLGSMLILQAKRLTNSSAAGYDFPPFQSRPKWRQISSTN